MDSVLNRKRKTFAQLIISYHPETQGKLILLLPNNSLLFYFQATSYSNFQPFVTSTAISKYHRVPCYIKIISQGDQFKRARQSPEKEDCLLFKYDTLKSATLIINVGLINQAPTTI